MQPTHIEILENTNVPNTKANHANKVKTIQQSFTASATDTLKQPQRCKYCSSTHLPRHYLAYGRTSRGSGEANHFKQV